MATTSPTTTKSTTGYVDPNHGVFGGALATGTVLSTGGTYIPNRNGLKMSIFFFSSMSEGDTWTSGLNGVVATAWQANDADLDRVGSRLVTQGTGQTDAVIRFDVGGGGAGWLWVLHAN